MSEILKKYTRWIIGISIVICIAVFFFVLKNPNTNSFDVSEAKLDRRSEEIIQSVQSQVSESLNESSIATIKTDFENCVKELLPGGGLEEWVYQLESMNGGGSIESEWVNLHFYSGTESELRIRFENEGDFYRVLRFGVDSEGLPTPQGDAESEEKIPLNQLSSQVLKLQEQQGVGPTFRQERKRIEFKGGPRDGQVIVFTRENDQIIDLEVITSGTRFQCQQEREDGTLSCHCQMY